MSKGDKREPTDGAHLDLQTNIEKMQQTVGPRIMTRRYIFSMDRVFVK